MGRTNAHRQYITCFIALEILCCKSAEDCASAEQKKSSENKRLTTACLSLAVYNSCAGFQSANDECMKIWE